MQSNEVEVVFCDLCGASVPAADLANQAAVPFQGKVVGACCLSALRASAPQGKTNTPRATGAGESRILPAAIAILAALAAVAIYVDKKVTDVDLRVQTSHEAMLGQVSAGGEVLQSVSMALDGAARKADLEALTERLGLVEGGLMAAGEQDRQVLEQLRAGLAALQQQQQRREAAIVDYRPLFDDLRQQLQRQGVLLAELRASADRARVADAASPPTEVPVPEVPSGLSPALQQLVTKLASPDPALRFEAVDELVRSKEPGVLPHLLPLAGDADAFVRRLTVEVLREFKHVDAVDALLTALDDADEYVRDTAWRSLRELTGQKLPFEATGSKDARSRAVQRWREWWEKSRDTFGA